MIGLILGVLSFANTIVRLPAGWLLDRTRARRPWIVGGLLLAALGTALVPHLRAPGVGLGPMVTHWGLAPAFALIGGATALGALVAAVVWDASSGSA